MPSFEETAGLVDEWYEGTKEWEASGGASSTEHVLLLLKVVLSAVDLKRFKKKGYTPLHALADMDKSKKTRCAEEKGMNMRGSVKLLQSCGLDIDTRSGNNAPFPDRTPLHRAAREGHFDLVKGLVGAGANVSATCENRWTALSFAAAGDHPLILRYLMRHGAEVEGSGALHQAAYVGSPECVEPLLKAGARSNEGARDDYTAAQKCCMGGGEKKGGRAEALSLLLEGGANVQVKNATDANLLHLAAGNGNVECIPGLLERGLQLDARDDSMCTPLHFACYGGRLACVKELMFCGTALDLVDDEGCTPLFDAVVGGHVTSVSALIQAGASVKVKSTTAITPLHLAAALGNMELSYLLVEAEAEIDALTNTGQSPLMACMHPDEQALSQKLGYYDVGPGSQGAREEVAEFLLKRGAAVDEKVIALAGEKGFGGVLASFINTKSNKVDALTDRFDTVAEHYSIQSGTRSQEVVHVRLMEDVSEAKGEKLYALSIPLVEQLMEKVREGGEKGGEDGTKNAGKASSAAGILPTFLDPPNYEYRSGKKGKGKDKKKEVTLKYDGVNFTEEGFEAVVKFVTTGSVEKLLTRRPGSAGNESSSGAEGGSSSSGTVRKECVKLFDEIRAQQALQAAEFFCLEGMSREVKTLMSEYGFALQEEKGGGGGGGREGADGEGEPSRKRVRA